MSANRTPTSVVLPASLPVTMAPPPLSLSLALSITLTLSLTITASWTPVIPPSSRCWIVTTPPAAIDRCVLSALSITCFASVCVQTSLFPSSRLAPCTLGFSNNLVDPVLLCLCDECRHAAFPGSQAFAQFLCLLVRHGVRKRESRRDSRLCILRTAHLKVDHIVAHRLDSMHIAELSRKVSNKDPPRVLGLNLSWGCFLRLHLRHTQLPSLHCCDKGVGGLRFQEFSQDHRRLLCTEYCIRALLRDVRSLQRRQCCT
mmetsp:Transcript_48462/g.89293  ORF Transcript_48462/g.89293 Transcript_48462/m.89293 type:complete len:258 (+) Transcript_48462:186-959(+)